MLDYGQLSREGFCRGRTGSFHPTVVMLQVFQAKLLKKMDEEGPDLEVFRKLCLATDLAVCAEKRKAQAVGCSMESIVILNCHLWLTLTEMKNGSVRCPCESPRSLW